MKIIEIDEGTRCWKGYKKKGMKTMFGKRVPNCVKNEELEGITICPNCSGLVYEDYIDENLRKWFKDKWVRFGPDGKIRGDCARGSSKEGKPKCLPRSKAHSLGKKGRKSAASRKRREDPNANRSGKAKNVKTKKEGTFDEKWSQKYKSSINCNNPKGFSQKAHCAGRNKK